MDKLLVITLILIVLLFVLYNKKEYNPEPVLVNPVTNSEKQKCTEIRTPCDPQDLNSCNSSCDEQQLKCVDLNSFTDIQGRQINGGGYACLPYYPDKTCNLNHGGVYVWTGYAGTENQDWDCYCMYPEYYGDPGCVNLNKGICSGGTWQDPIQGEVPSSKNCICPKNTTLLLRGESNTPYCAPNTPPAGGMYGTVGNLKPSPNWENVSVRRNVILDNKSVPESNNDWATRIVNEIAVTGTQELVNLISGMLYSLPKLSNSLVKDMCGVLYPNVAPGVCDNINVETQKAWYTFFPRDEVAPR